MEPSKRRREATQMPWGSGMTKCLRTVQKASEMGAEEMKQRRR